MKGTLYKPSQPIMNGKFWNMKSFVVAKIVAAGAAVFWNALYHHRFLYWACAQDSLTSYQTARKQICRQLYKKVLRCFKSSAFPLKTFGKAIGIRPYAQRCNWVKRVCFQSELSHGRWSVQRLPRNPFINALQQVFVNFPFCNPQKWQDHVS